MEPSQFVNAASRLNASEHLRVRHLRLLELVERGGSLSQAARSLHLSQPAVTKMLHELEAVFGPALVNRGARGGRLTERGQRTLARLRVALAHFDTALQESGDEEAVVRLGVLPLAAMTLLPATVNRMHALHPTVRLALRESTVKGLLNMLMRGEIDALVGRLDSDWLAQAHDFPLTCTDLIDEALAVAAAPDHPLARARSVSLPQLATARWALAHAQSNTRRAFDEAFLQAGLPPRLPAMESMSFHTNLHVVARSDLLTLAPRSAVQAYAGLGMVKALNVRVDFPVARLVFATAATGPRLPAVQALCDALCEASQQGH